MEEETLRNSPDDAQTAKEPIFKHLDSTDEPELRTIRGIAEFLNLAQHTVTIAINRLELDGRVFGEGKRPGGLETWRTDNTPASFAPQLF